MKPAPKPALLRRVVAFAVVTAALAAPATASAEDRLIVGFTDASTVTQQVAALRAAGVDDATAQTVTSTGDMPRLDIATVVVPEGEGAAVLNELDDMTRVEFVEPDRLATITWNPGDPMLMQQWGLSKVGATTAWNTARGGGALVAVVDTGVSYVHPELRGKVQLGYDFVESDADPMDEQGHGTHVSGIVAGIAGNAVGGAGLAPNARILAVRVLDQNGSGYYSWIARGITYAADNGAKVINLSLGGGSASTTLEQAVNYATAKGAVVTCATGNDSAASLGYPARYASCFAVGSSTSSDTRSSFSNHGTGIDVVAPGSNILSSVMGGGYESWSGTSMATPFVSGLAALLVSQGLNRAQVEATITATSRDLGTVGYDTTYGHGRIDAAAAVAAAAALDVPPADSVDPQVSGVTLGAPVTTYRTSYRWRWHQIRSTSWRAVGTTDYVGTYSWTRTRIVDARTRRVLRYRMDGGTVFRRTVTLRKRRHVTRTATVWRPVTITASDDVTVDRAGLSVNGSWIGADWNGSDGWTVNWRCRAGTSTFTGYAFDAADNSSTLAVQQAVTC